MSLVQIVEVIAISAPDNRFSVNELLLVNAWNYLPCDIVSFTFLKAYKRSI